MEIKPHMQTRTINWVIGFILLFSFQLCTTGSAADGLTVKLTTKAGAEVTVQSAGFYADDSLLAGSIATFTPSWQKLQYVILEVAKGAYLAFPIGLFQQAELEGGVQTVTLNSGEKFQGKLKGYVETDKSEKRHFLSTAAKVRVETIPDWERGEVERSRTFQPKELWQLEVIKPVSLTYVVSSPDLKFVYHPESIPAETHFAACQEKFEIQNESQVLPVTLDDVTEASFSPVTSQKGAISVDGLLKLKSGSDVKGKVLIRKGSDKESAIRWVLAATVRGNGTKILLSNPHCRLSRIN